MNDGFNRVCRKVFETHFVSKCEMKTILNIRKCLVLLTVFIVAHALVFAIETPDLQHELLGSALASARSKQSASIFQIPSHTETNSSQVIPADSLLIQNRGRKWADDLKLLSSECQTVFNFTFTRSSTMFWFQWVARIGFWSSSAGCHLTFYQILMSVSRLSATTAECTRKTAAVFYDCTSSLVDPSRELTRFNP